MKNYICILFTLVFMVSLSSCSSDSYRNDISCEAILSELSEELGGDWGIYPKEQLMLIFGSDAPKCDSCIIYSSKTDDIDEIGVFRSEDTEERENIKKYLEEYISDMSLNSRAFIMSYAPNEIQKLDSAEVFSVGEYVFYTVLDPNIREVSKEKIKEIL